MRLAETVIGDQTEPNQVLVNILRKRDLLNAGDPTHKAIRPALVINGGGMRGTFAAGVVTVLDELGLKDTFDNIIGISAGSGTGAYLMSGQGSMSVDIYAENFTQREFTNGLRRRSIVNIGYLNKLFYDLKPLDRHAVLSSRTGLHIGVTDVETAKGRYFDISKSGSPAIVTAIQTSASLPGISPPIKIGQKRYVDGIVGCKNPIGYAFDELGATDVLAIVNKPLVNTKNASPLEKIWVAYAMRRYSADFRRAYLERDFGSDQNGSTEYPADRRIAILCPTEMPLGKISHDSAKVRQIAEQAIRQTRQAFL